MLFFSYRTSRLVWYLVAIELPWSLLENTWNILCEAVSCRMHSLHSVYHFFYIIDIFRRYGQAIKKSHLRYRVPRAKLSYLMYVICWTYCSFVITQLFKFFLSPFIPPFPLCLPWDNHSVASSIIFSIRVANLRDKSQKVGYFRNWKNEQIFLSYLDFAF